MLVGPYLEFADYMNLVDCTTFKALEKAEDERAKAVRVPGRLIPRGRKRVAYRKMVVGLVYLGLFVVFGGKYNYSVALQEWFPRKNLFYR